MVLQDFSVAPLLGVITVYHVDCSDLSDKFFGKRWELLETKNKIGGGSMKEFEDKMLSDKIAFLSKMLKDTYGTSSIGLKYENDGEVITRKYGSIDKEKLTAGKDSRFYRLFEYTFTDKTARYSAEHKRKKFVRKDIFRKAFAYLKEVFDLSDSSVPIINSDTSDEKLQGIGNKLYKCYSVVLDMLLQEDELNIDKYKQKISEILSAVSENGSDELLNEDYYKRIEAFINDITDVADVSVSNMDIFYKSGSLNKYADIKHYAKSKGIEIIDFDSESVVNFAGNAVYRYFGECSFAVDNSYITVSIKPNGEEIGAFTSEKNWVNTSLLMNYVYQGISRECVCYFKYDKGKVLQFLQIGDD